MTNRNIGKSAILLSLLLCAACAGEKSAREAAHRAANSVNDLQAHLGDSVAAYREIREQQYANLTALGVSAADIEGKSDEHIAAWATAEEKNSSEIYEAVIAANSNEELLKTAPFRVIEPAPLFQAPQIDSKTMADLVSRLEVIAKKPSLTNRLSTFATFVIAAGKEYQKAKDRGGAAPAEAAADAGADAAAGKSTEAAAPQASAINISVQSLLPRGEKAISTAQDIKIAPAFSVVADDPGEPPAVELELPSLPAQQVPTTINENEIADNGDVTNQLMDRLTEATKPAQ